MWAFTTVHTHINTQLMFSLSVLSYQCFVVSVFPNFLCKQFAPPAVRDLTLTSFFNHHPSPPSVFTCRPTLSAALSALCGGLACVNMTDWAPVGTLIASFHGCESVLWSGRVNKLWIQEQGKKKLRKERERGESAEGEWWNEEWMERWTEGRTGMNNTRADVETKRGNSK